MKLPQEIDEPNAEVSGYRFEKSHLAIDARRPGISGFTRVRNGQDFIEVTVRSHLQHLDELVVVHNRCTDATPEILSQLQREFGPERLRVIHYTDSVFPPGSTGHQKTPADTAASMVNYSNFALACTRYSHACKVDDDQLALEAPLAHVTSQLRAGGYPPAFLSFSGLNLTRRPDGSLAIAGNNPISGNGDIGFFRVNELSCFRWDRRFERVGLGGYRRQFVGYLYWHLKYLKQGGGFANYDLAENPNSRFARQKAKLESSRAQYLDPPALTHRIHPTWKQRLLALVSNKQATNLVRNAELAAEIPDETTQQAVERTVRADLQSAVLLKASTEEAAA